MAKLSKAQKALGYAPTRPGQGFSPERGGALINAPANRMPRAIAYAQKQAQKQAMPSKAERATKQAGMYATRPTSGTLSPTLADAVGGIAGSIGGSLMGGQTGTLPSAPRVAGPPTGPKGVRKGLGGPVISGRPDMPPETSFGQANRWRGLSDRGRGRGRAMRGGCASGASQNHY